MNIQTQESSRVLVVLGHPPSPSETFLDAHIRRLPARVAVAYGSAPNLDGKNLRSQLLPARIARKAFRTLRGSNWNDGVTAGFLKAFARFRPDAVLAEYGENAASVREACGRSGVPLIAHFHGYDASEHACLRAMEIPYRLLFRDCQAIIAVSREMRARLIAMGAPADKVHLNPCGVNCELFWGADPASAPPIFIAVGRLTEKKAPNLTLKAFAQVHKAVPEARLRIIGFGPMREQCQSLAVDLGITGAVDFLGTATPELVQREMRQARCFVQHSMQAANGDSEGTPLAIMEAGASGLPVISTRHGGIPDVVVEEETGLLVDERDVSGMARHMIRIAIDQRLAARLGSAARARIESEFTMDLSINRLWSIIKGTIRPAPAATHFAHSRRHSQPRLIEGLH